jgi:hypothetical protein
MCSASSLGSIVGGIAFLGQPGYCASHVCGKPRGTESFDVFHVTSEEALDHGDRVVGIGTLRIRGKGSGAEAVVPTAVVLTFAQGKVVRFEEFGERARALEAAGLAE